MKHRVAIIKWTLWMLVLGSVGVTVWGTIDELHQKRAANVCASNLQDIGIADIQYVDDWDTRYPPANRWTEVLRPYIYPSWLPRRTTNVFVCPAAPFSRYSMNAILSSESYEHVPREASVPIQYESTTLVDNFSDEGGSAPMKKRHKGGVGVVFTDGRVRFMDKLDFSYKPRDFVWITTRSEDVSYPRKSLPSSSAPYEANMAAMLQPFIDKMPQGCRMSWWNKQDELIVDCSVASPTVRQAVKRAIQDIYPKWKHMRELSNEAINGAYPVCIDERPAGRSVTLVMADKL